MLFEELQGFDDPDDLVHVTPERLIVDDLVPHDPVLVDDEGGAHGDACGIVGVTAVALDPVGLSDRVVHVRRKRVAQLADPAVFDGGIAPREVGVVRVDRDADDLTAKLAQTKVKSSG